MIPPPRFVVEADVARYDEIVAAVAASGWRVRVGFNPGGERQGIVCTAEVRNFDDASRAVLAAVGGTGLVVHATADASVIHVLCEDLRRLGPVVHITSTVADELGLLAEEVDLLSLLASGLSVSDAATRLAISKRTADRRLARARRQLGVERTAQAARAVAEARADRHITVPQPPA